MNKKKLSKEENYFLKMGTQFGYPQCCIKAFLKDIAELRATGKIQRTAAREKWAFQGFVPCDLHAKVIQKHGYAYMTQGINTRRSKTYPYPFPLDQEMIMDAILGPLRAAAVKATAEESSKHTEENCICNDCKSKQEKNAEDLQVPVADNNG